MVEIIKLIRRIFVLLAAVLLTAWASHAQQPVGARIAGLEDNTEYKSLLDRDAQLQAQEDSIVNAVEQVRRQLRENPENRQAHSQEILRLETKIFEVRNAKGGVIDRINAIEQQWVLANLDGTARKSGQTLETDAGTTVPDSLKVRNLVDNLYFLRNLPVRDYDALRRAQQREGQAEQYVNRYLANHKTLSELSEAYAAVQVEDEAIGIYGKYETLQGLNRVLADSLSQTWNYVFDNKSYAYGYLMDKLRKDDILAREEERLSAATRKLGALRGETASEEVADYLLRKQVLLDYEAAVAGALGLDAARDSLQGVATRMQTVDVRLPKVELAERTFIRYDSVTFNPATRYSYQHPIPECRVYARGTIYRVLLGTFNTKRAADLFRGAYPLCYQIDAEGKWLYFAGGFATKDETEKAQKQLKTRGFQRPEIVVWTDGAYRNLSREPEAQTVVYRVEIKGSEALSDAVKQTIAEVAEGRELSRGGQQLFVVGMFDDRGVADRVAAAVTQTDAALEIKVAEIAQ